MGGVCLNSHQVGGFFELSVQQSRITLGKGFWAGLPQNCAIRTISDATLVIPGHVEDVNPEPTTG